LKRGSTDRTPEWEWSSVPFPLEKIYGKRVFHLLRRDGSPLKTAFYGIWYSSQWYIQRDKIRDLIEKTMAGVHSDNGKMGHGSQPVWIRIVVPNDLRRELRLSFS
jgi:hypothetical protein